MTTFTEVLPERKSSKHSACHFTPGGGDFHPPQALLLVTTTHNHTTEATMATTKAIAKRDAGADGLARLTLEVMSLHDQMERLVARIQAGEFGPDPDRFGALVALLMDGSTHLINARPRMH